MKSQHLNSGYNLCDIYAGVTRSAFQGIIPIYFAPLLPRHPSPLQITKGRNVDHLLEPSAALGAGFEKRHRLTKSPYQHCMTCVVTAGAGAEAETGHAFCRRTRTRLVLQSGSEPQRHDARVRAPSPASVMAARPWAASRLGR